MKRALLTFALLLVSLAALSGPHQASLGQGAPVPINEDITGLSWDGTTLGTGPNYTDGDRRMLLWEADLPDPYPGTYMFKVFVRELPATDNRFTAHFFRGNSTTFQWGDDYCSGYYGLTEYPSPARTSDGKTEVSAGQGFGSCQDEVARDNGSSPYTTYDQWYSRAITARVVDASPDYYEHKGYVDLETGVTSAYTITAERNSAWNPPPHDSIFMGQTGQTEEDGQSWGGEPRWEESNYIVRGMQFYTVVLTTMQMQTLSACDTNACVLSEAASLGVLDDLWYLNMNPTPTDVTDKSGNGHHGTWQGPARPTLYTGSLIPANDDFFEEVAYAMAA